MTTRKIRTALVQQQNGADREMNRQRLKEKAGQAAREGADLVVFQELHDTLYFCQTMDPRHFDLADTIPGPSTAYYAEIARENGIVLVTSLFERRTAGLYHNTAVVFEKDGTIAGYYRKTHIPDDPGYCEKFYFTPGDTGFRPIQTSVGKLGVLICWDQWFPEAARLMTLQGADLLVYPTAIGWDSTDTTEEKQRQLEAWITVQRGHAIANGLPLVAINRVGTEADPSGQTSGIHFWGNSFACGPQGEILTKAPAGNEEILVAFIDLDRSEQVRRMWPFLRDRRTNCYPDITKRYIDKPLS